MLNEVRVISAIVKNKDIAPAISNTNIDNLFDTHKDVWGFMKDYYYKHRAVISEDILIEEFGGEKFRLVDTSGPVKHYLEQLRDEYQTVHLDKLARGLSRTIGIESNEAIITYLQKRISDISNATANIRDLDITNDEQAIDHYQEMRRKMEENGGVMGIRTGFDSIDANYSTGCAPGHLICILSRTGQGKSWLALDIAINAWAQGKKVLYVSLEMPPEAVRDRAYTLMSKGDFSMSDLSRAQMDMDMLKKWTEVNFKSDFSFVATSSDGMGDFSSPHLQAKIDRYGPDLVVVDYLQLMTDKRNSTGETERVRNVSKELKAIALGNEIPIIMVAAASSHDTKEYSSPPQIYECAGSRQAVYDVDLLLSIFSHKQADGTLMSEVVSRKNRWGPDFGFMLIMDIAGGKLREQWDEDLVSEE